VLVWRPVAAVVSTSTLLLPLEGSTVFVVAALDPIHLIVLVAPIVVLATHALTTVLSRVLLLSVIVVQRRHVGGACAAATSIAPLVVITMASAVPLGVVAITTTNNLRLALLHTVLLIM